MTLNRRTRIDSALDHLGRGYPRPQLVRGNWLSLNGVWDFALDTDARWLHPGDVAWDAEITVPFAPEAPASGIGYTGFFRACWYRRRIDIPDMPREARLLLHFGAVDYEAAVWADGRFLGGHRGGYTPFTLVKVDLAAKTAEVGSSR